MAGISRVEGGSLVVYDTLFHQISPPPLYCTKKVSTNPVKNFFIVWLQNNLAFCKALYLEMGILLN